MIRSLAKSCKSTARVWPAMSPCDISRRCALIECRLCRPQQTHRLSTQVPVQFGSCCRGATERALPAMEGQTCQACTEVSAERLDCNRYVSTQSLRPRASECCCGPSGLGVSIPELLAFKAADCYEAESGTENPYGSSFLCAARKNKKADFESPEMFHERAVADIALWEECLAKSGMRACIKRYHPQQLIKGMYSEFVEVRGHAFRALDRRIASGTCHVPSVQPQHMKRECMSYCQR